MGISLALHFLICTYEIMGSLMRGMGRSMLPAVITILGSVCFRIVWLLTVFAQNHTFETLIWVYPVSWILTGSMMFVAFLFTWRSVIKNRYDSRPI
jgi:Na+-driven multidrug efflux pump